MRTQQLLRGNAALTVVQLPEGSRQALVQPIGPPVVCSVPSFPRGFALFFFQTLSSGSDTLSG